MNMSLLRGKKATIVINIAKSKFKRRLEFIKKGYGFLESKVLTTIFLQGLFDYQPLLKGRKLYLTDEKFKAEVDRMPHDFFYDFYDM